MQTLAAKAKQNPSTTHLHFPFEQVTVLDQYHHGGYAKTTKELKEFIETFIQTNQFPIEPTYTGKVLYALSHQIATLHSAFKNILFIHTGGVV
jgi:1-aminocyclopropane-1-carboxylate deaminase